MRNLLATALLLFTASAMFAQSVAAPVQAAPQIAITFDDLPAHGPLPPGESRIDIASKIIAALHEAHVPPTYGFVNGLRTQEQPGDVAVLKAWHDAGNPLGDHTWSHMNLNQHSLEEFEADIHKNQPLLTQLMKDKDKNEDWHWFRFPFLAEGDTPAKRGGVRKFLAQQGYKVAAVTMSFGDYEWNEPYARCKEAGNNKAIALLESNYLSAADASVSYYREMSHALYGRDIPYVLLMHIGAFDAEMLPLLLSLYQSKGFQFVTLAQAEKDEFYRVDTDPSLPVAPDTLEDLMAERHLQLPPNPSPALQFDDLCR
jgi:peptidoglycan/xylan/chitin deacetylase (PgdA/CDA1 family)